MPEQCVTVDVARTITLAPGLYAPGHLGALTRFVPFELVDAVLDESRAVERRLRALPSRVGVYLLLAMALFEQVSVTGVWDKLIFSLGGHTLAAPSESALRALRRRVGVAPLHLLFDTLAVPLAPPGLTGTCYRRWRTVAFDGCSSIKAPDHPRNRTWLGKVTYHAGPAGYPALLLMTLVETGTRGMLGAAFGPANSGELGYASRLLDRIDGRMLLLLDRGFDSNDFLCAVQATGAQFLARAKSNRRPVIAARLPDGSYLTRIAGSTLRVIEARITATGADGTKATSHYRLITTLTDHRADPAPVLMRLYHERWEIESAYYALRHTLLGARVLRSKDPAGLTQELWAILVCYQALRMAITDAAMQRRDTDADRLSFTLALQAARDSVITATGILPDQRDPLGRIGQALIASPMRPRRPRFSARKVKCPISRYAAAKDAHRPAASTRILAINVLLLDPTPHIRPKRGPGKPGNRAAATLERVRSARALAILALLGTDPARAWPARQIAEAIGHTGPYRILNTQLGQWADNGLQPHPSPTLDTTPPALTSRHWVKAKSSLDLPTIARQSRSLPDRGDTSTFARSVGAAGRGRDKFANPPWRRTNYHYTPLMPAFEDTDQFGLQCPHCNKPSVATVAGHVVTRQKYHKATETRPSYHSDEERVVLIRCSECHKPVLLQQENPAFWWETSTALWPPPLRPISLDVPSAIRETCNEARGCFQHSFYRATVVMVRRALEGVCRDQGSTKGTLAASLADLERQGRLDKRLAEWAHELRSLGNTGAHFTLEEISREDAADALAFVEALLEYLYVLSAQFENFRKRRTEGAQREATRKSDNSDEDGKPEAEPPNPSTGYSDEPPF